MYRSSEGYEPEVKCKQVYTYNKCILFEKETGSCYKIENLVLYWKLQYFSVKAENIKAVHFHHHTCLWCEWRTWISGGTTRLWCKPLCTTRRFSPSHMYTFRISQCPTRRHSFILFFSGLLRCLCLAVTILVIIIFRRVTGVWPVLSA